MREREREIERERVSKREKERERKKNVREGEKVDLKCARLTAIHQINARAQKK